MSAEVDVNNHQEEQQVSESLLWTALLAPPIVWAVQFEICYALVPFRCYGGTRAPLYAFTTVALLLTIAAGFLALINWRTVDRVWPNESTRPGSHIAFMSVLGLMSSLLFSLILIAEIIAVAVLHPCWR